MSMIAAAEGPRPLRRRVLAWARRWAKPVWGATALALGLPLLAACSETPSSPSQTQPERATGLAKAAAVTANRFMVAAAHPLAVEAGREMLRAGGSAVDAAIATQLVLGLVEPQSSGLGGGAFLVHWDAAARALATYDGRETAPAAATPDRFLRDGRPMPFDAAMRTGLAVGTPGLVRLLQHAHAKHGRLPWARLFEPARRLANEGFPISPRLHALLTAETAARFAEGARRLYFDADGRAWPIGHRLANPAYAGTLVRLAADGADAFYAGPIAEAIVAAVRAAPVPGDLALGDLAQYRVVERPPVCVPYRGYRVCGMGPPSSGGIAVGQALMLLEGFDLGRGPREAMHPAAVHLMVEALKLAFADRDWYVADPEHVAQPSGLLDASYMAERRGLLSTDTTLARAYPGLPPGAVRRAHGIDETHEIAGTSHISIVDADGNAVAMTTTIEAGFGSRLWAAGFLLNNQLTDFSFRARDAQGRPIANAIAPGKRPRSSMSPTIVFDGAGTPVIVTGSPGGARIIPYVTKSLVALIDWQLDPAAAAALPNIASAPRALVLEQPGTSFAEVMAAPDRILETLRRMIAAKSLGQNVRLEAMTSGVHTIRRHPDGRLEGGADPRREGVALGD